jgi:hypothetical protein
LDKLVSLFADKAWCKQRGKDGCTVVRDREPPRPRMLLITDKRTGAQLLVPYFSPRREVNALMGTATWSWVLA